MDIPREQATSSARADVAVSPTPSTASTYESAAPDYYYAAPPPHTGSRDSSDAPFAGLPTLSAAGIAGTSAVDMRQQSHSFPRDEKHATLFVDPAEARRADEPTLGDAPLELHIYRAGLTSSDELVKAEDKSTVLFQITSKRSIFSPFAMSIFPADSSTPVAEITKGAYGFSSTDLKVFLPPTGWASVLYATGVMTKTREFVGMPNVGRFHWATEMGTGEGLGGRAERLHCVDTRTGQLIAIWRRTGYALKKTGNLSVRQSHKGDVVLILATALVVEEWRREQAASFKSGQGTL